MPDLSTIPPEDLRDAWVSLASNGTPPAADLAARVLPAWSVGLEGWLDRITQTFLSDHCLRNSHFKLAVAPYGGGKTHFLLAVAGRAAQEGWAVCYLQCKDHVSLSDWFGLCKHIISGIKLPAAEGRGVRPLARAALAVMRQKASSPGVPDPEDALNESITALEEADWPHPAFGRIMAAYLRHLNDPSAQPVVGEAARRWLECDPGSLSPAEREALHLGNLLASERPEHGRTLFASLVKFIPRSKAHGLALLLDEMDAVFSARGKAMERIHTAMRILLDAPDNRDVGETPLFGLFAAVPEVIAKINQGPSPLRSRIDCKISFHEGNDYAAQIDLSQVGKPEEVLWQIAENLLLLRNSAFESKLDEPIQRSNAASLARVSFKRQQDADARRPFVKTWCELLDAQALNGEREFTEDELNDLLMGSSNAIREAQQQPDEDDLA